MALGLAGDKLIVEMQSGMPTELPFFDSLSELVKFSLVHLPYDGATRVTMPKEVECRLDDLAAGCDVQSSSTVVEQP